MSYHGYHHVILHCYSNTGEDLGSLLLDGKSSGFLSNAVPPPGLFNFTRNFTINPYWYNTFEENAIVSIM